MRNWYTMKAPAPQSADAEIVIYDEIGQSWWGEDSVTAKQFLADLTALGDVENITLRVNSPGGNVFDGVAIHNALKNNKAKVTAHVDGIAASVASYVVMAADKIVMPANSFMLIHGASGVTIGSAADHRAAADDLNRIDNSLTATYVARAKSTTDKVSALMKEDRLMSAAEAKEWGFADEVTAEKKIAANFSLRLLPPSAAERFRAGAGTPDTPQPQPQPPPPPQPQPPQPQPPAASASAAVVDLNAAKKQGVDEHREYVASITDICTLAAAPERVGAYVRAGTPVDQVRKELLDMRAAAPAAPVMPQHPLAPQTPPATAWAKITDKINARLNRT